MPIESSTVALFNPTESLRRQVVAFICSPWKTAIALMDSAESPFVRATAETADLLIIDATERTSEGLAALEQAAPTADDRSLAVYTERMHTGLELFVRLRGVFLLLGPLEQSEWQEVARRSRLARHHEDCILEQQ